MFLFRLTWLGWITIILGLIAINFLAIPNGMNAMNARSTSLNEQGLAEIVSVVLLDAWFIHTVRNFIKLKSKIGGPFHID